MHEVFYRVGYFYVFDKDEFEVWQGVSPFGRNMKAIRYQDVRSIRTGYGEEVIVNYATDGESMTVEFRPTKDAEAVADEIRQRIQRSKT